MTFDNLPSGIPSRGGWSSGARSDPITGLVAFPDFHRAFPLHLADSVVAGAFVGVAIGDVDHLKGYVEGSNAVKPESFGHLAGNAFMAQLGIISAAWFQEQPFPAGSMSTFGGDEVIIAATTEGPEAFASAIVALRDLCRQRLPQTVSFALTVVADRTPGLSARLDDPAKAANLVLAGVDRTLFRRKAVRRRDTDNGFVIAVDLDLRMANHAVA